ncbi:MAG TPA: hypothetical protein VM554_12865 [Acidisarcina sp.]|nr:hypothetical protein [Acidisarcina sp.]
MKLKYLGVPVYMNGQNYYIPSLSTRDFRAQYATLTRADEQPQDALATFDAYIPIIGLAVRRNYPEVTDEQLAEWLDLHTFQLAIRAVQSASGMAPVSEGE